MARRRLLSMCISLSWRIGEFELDPFSRNQVDKVMDRVIRSLWAADRPSRFRLSIRTARAVVHPLRLCPLPATVVGLQSRRISHSPHDNLTCVCLSFFQYQLLGEVSGFNIGNGTFEDDGWCRLCRSSQVRHSCCENGAQCS